MEFGSEDRGDSLGAGFCGLVAASLLVALGTVWAFERGAQDFSVFYQAWKLVVAGQGVEIYRESPDRFLYAPGFAWLLSPLALLPRSFALAIWCFLKAGVVGYVVREFQRARQGGLASFGVAAWGVVLLARPLLIDFQYGQVNILILGACVWALQCHGRRAANSDPGWVDGASWFVLAVAAVTKVFPLPLLVLPWIPLRAGAVSGGDASALARKRQAERVGSLIGLALVLTIPVVSVGFSGLWPLFSGWKDALLARGLPFESHNQSFSALLHRWFSGELVHIVSLGMNPVRIGWSGLSEQGFHLLSVAWILACAGAVLSRILMLGQDNRRRDVAILVALLVLPSHLVWKPYFVMFLPAGVLLAGAFRDWGGGRILLAAMAWAGMNILGFDVLGPDWGARVEAASQMLWAGLAYLALLPR